MARLALVDALTDFGALMAPPAPVLQLVPQDPDAERFDHLLEAAVRQAEEAVTERLNARHQAELATLRETHHAEIAEIGERLADGMAGLIATQSVEIEERLIAQTGRHVASILAAVASEALAQKAVAGLAEAISESLHDRTAVRLKVAGPVSLHAMLAARLDAKTFAVEFTETTALDLTVEIDEQVFATRFADWAADLGQAMPEVVR